MESWRGSHTKSHRQQEQDRTWVGPSETLDPGLLADLSFSQRGLALLGGLSQGLL